LIGTIDLVCSLWECGEVKVCEFVNEIDDAGGFRKLEMLRR